MINLSGEQVCALEHALSHALEAKTWFATKDGNNGVWVPSHTAIHKSILQDIRDKLEKAKK